MNNAATPGGILAGEKSIDSTYNNVVVNVPLEYSLAGSTSNKKGFGTIPLFGANTDTSNNINNT